MVPTIQPEPDFSLTYGFRGVVHNVKFVTYIKFQNILRTGCKDIEKNFKNTPKWGFPSIVTPKIFKIKIGLCHFNPYGALTSCKQLEKTNGRSLRCLKMDRRTNRPMDGSTDMGDYIGAPSDKSGPKLFMFSRVCNTLASHHAE